MIYERTIPFFNGVMNLTFKSKLTAKALNTKGRPAILLLDILKCVNLSPRVVMRSDSALLDTALRELAVAG